MYKLSGHSLTKGAWFVPETQPMIQQERESSCSITIPHGDPEIGFDDWILDDDWPEGPYVWRVKGISEDANGETDTIELEHVIMALDGPTLGEVTPATIAGSGATTCTAKQAAQYILGQQSDFVLGDFEYSVSLPYEFDGDTLLDALETVTETLEDSVWEFDLSVYPFKVHVRQRDNTVRCEMRGERNLTTLTKSISRSGMYTRIYPTGKNNLKISGSGYLSKNENLYGRIDKRETDESKTTVASLQAWAQARLNRHCEPTVSISISGLELSQETGEDLDRLTMNKNCRVPLPKYATTITERIVKKQWRDRRKEPENVSITLANNSQDVTTIIKKSNRAGGKARAGQAKQNYLFEANGENLRYEVFDECGHVHGLLRMTEESLRIAFENLNDSTRSEFLMTAESLRIQFENEINSTRSEFQMTSESLRIMFENEISSVRSELEMTAESLRISFTNEASSLRSEMQMTAESLRISFNNEASSLRSAINVQAGRINLVVEGSGSSAAIRLSAIVDGINQSELELSADRVVIGSGSDKKKVKVYVDGQISATEGQITNLKTGTTKATLINSDAITADGISATEYMYTPSMTIGSGTQGGSGTLYFRGNQYYRQGVTMGPSTNYFIEGHFLGDNSTTLNLNHYHTIVATEGTGADAGKIILTLTDPVSTSDTSNHTTNFNIAATTAYQNGVLAARNAVKVQPFTADARQGALNDHRQFTYTTDAPTPASGTSQADTWYLVPTGTWSSNKQSVSLRYGSDSGTAYATAEVDASSIVTAAGYSGRAAVGLSDPTADQKTQTDDNRTFTVSTTGRTNSSGTADNLSKTVPLHLYAGSWSNNKCTVYMKWGASGGSSGTTYAQKEVDASSLVTSAGYAGRAAVTLNDPTWNAITGAITDSRTLSVTTNGRTNSSGTTDNLTKSMALYLTSSGLTVTLRAGSSSGTAVASKTCSDANLVAGNIKSGVSIFGVTGSYAPSDTVTIYPSSNQSLSPGGSVTVYARKNGSNVANITVSANTDSNLKAANIKKNVTIFGVTGSYAASVANDDIQIGSYNNVSTEPSGTAANTMKATILAAINNHNWFRFKVTVSGTSAEKYYKMKFD